MNENVAGCQACGVIAELGDGGLCLACQKAGLALCDYCGQWFTEDEMSSDPQLCEVCYQHLEDDLYDSDEEDPDRDEDDD